MKDYNNTIPIFSAFLLAFLVLFKYPFDHCELIKTQNNRKMLKFFTISSLIIFLTSGLAVNCQSKDNVRLLLGNEWIGKYKKLKNDLENKVALVKDMEDLSEQDISDIRDSYARTSLLLENWLLQVVNTMESADQSKIETFSKGDLDADLQEGFRNLLTAYADDFTSQYEEKTGRSDNFVINLESNNELKEIPGNITWKFEREEVLAGIRPLLPNDWNSIN